MAGTRRAASKGKRAGPPAKKRDAAVGFIRRIRDMDKDDLHQLILDEAGEDLAQFFLAYATDLIEREPERAVENASSLLLIGYLIRGFEEEETESASPVALAAGWLH